MKQSVLKITIHEFHLHAVELYNLGPSIQTSLASLITLCSIKLQKDEMVVLGGITLGGVVKPFEDLAGSLQMAFDSGAKRVFLPMIRGCRYGQKIRIDSWLAEIYDYNILNNSKHNLS